MSSAEALDVLDQVEERRLSPVDVIDHRQHRLLGGEALQQAADRPKRLLDGSFRVRQPDGGA
jgi:hypothetical protein